MVAYAGYYVQPQYCGKSSDWVHALYLFLNCIFSIDIISYIEYFIFHFNVHQMSFENLHCSELLPYFLLILNTPMPLVDWINYICSGAGNFVYIICLGSFECIKLFSLLWNLLILLYFGSKGFNTGIMCQGLMMPLLSLVETPWQESSICSGVHGVRNVTPGCWAICLCPGKPCRAWFRGGKLLCAMSHH